MASADRYIIVNKLLPHPLVVFLLLSLVASVFYPGLKGPLVLDDYPNLSPLQQADQIGKIDYSEFILGNRSGIMGRPVAMASFAFNHWLADEFRVFDLKLTNLLIHLINGLLLYSLLLNLPTPRLSSNIHRQLALLVTACWMLTPFNSGTVLYVIQRMCLLETLFVLLGCLSFVLAKNGGKWRKRLFLLSAACLPLAFFSKENGILLPLFLILIELCFYDTLRTKCLAMRTMQRTLAVGGVLCLGIGIIILLDHFDFLNYTQRPYTLKERLYTESVVVLDYLGATILPLSLDAGLFNDDYMIRTTFWNVATLTSSILWLSILLGSSIALASNRYRRIAFGGLFFLIGHVVESTILPLEIYFEHRNYLPSIGIFYGVLTLIGLGIEKIKIAWTGKYLAITYCLFLTVFASQKIALWSSWESLYKNSYAHHPYSVRVNLGVVDMLTGQGNLEQALAVNQQLIDAQIKYSFRPKMQRLWIYCELGDAMPDKEYTYFGATTFHHYFITEVSTALSHLLESYRQNHCDFIDFEKIVGALATWVDIALEEGRVNANEIWHIEYYIVEFLNHLGNEHTANQRLITHARIGGKGARHYLEYQDQSK